RMRWRHGREIWESRGRACSARNKRGGDRTIVALFLRTTEDQPLSSRTSTSPVVASRSAGLQARRDLSIIFRQYKPIPKPQRAGLHEPDFVLLRIGSKDPRDFFHLANRRVSAFDVDVAGR